MQQRLLGRELDSHKDARCKIGQNLCPKFSPYLSKMFDENLTVELHPTTRRADSITERRYDTN